MIGRRGLIGAALALALVWGSGCVQIATVTPNPASAGAQITISGSGFGATQGTGKVTYDGATVAVVSWSDTSIQATLPSPKPNGTYTLQVTANGGMASFQHTINTPVATWDSATWDTSTWAP